MLKVKEITSYKIETLAGLSVPEAFGLAIMIAEGDEEAALAIADIACSWKCVYSGNGRMMTLSSDKEDKPAIQFVIGAEGKEVHIIVESISYDNERVAIVSDTWPVEDLVDILEVEI